MPHSITITDNIEYSDGPDRLIGGHSCADQHDGITREGHLDSCCCCDPCRYIRPPLRSATRYCCRCVPKIICMVFTPDGATACCQTIVLPMLADFDNVDFEIVWSGEISGMTATLTLGRLVDDGPCHWILSSNQLYDIESIEVDHVNVSCLSVPSIFIDNVTDDNGCVGTITFSNYEAEKLPFSHDIGSELSAEYARMVVPSWATSSTPGTPQCTCDSVPKYLCVDGVRKRDGSREQIRFAWDEDNGDRWSYLPCDGDLTLDQEHIYLRGDNDGNCYLEFDFDQDDGFTNSWSDPQNTLGIDIHEIRPGMVAIESCGCEIHAHSIGPPASPGDSQRFVNISAGDCGCWKYRCGKCRCVPVKVCVIGEIDGVTITGEATWDGKGWQFAADGYMPAFEIRLGPNECDECILTVIGTFSVPFGPSSVIDCGEFLSGEMKSVYDYTQPGVYNWLWVSSSPCGCNVVACGICAAERCGGPPATLYYDLEGRRNFFPPDPYDTEVCNITVELHYFQRWTQTLPRRIICGYIGHQTVYCPPYYTDPEQYFVVRVSISGDGFGQTNYQVDRIEIDTGEITSILPSAIWPPIGSSPATCDPFLFVKDWNNGSLACLWGCNRNGPFEIKQTFTE